MEEVIVGGVFTLLGSVIAFLGTYLFTRDTRREERYRKRIKSYLEEIKGFYNLEQLYMNEVAALREKLPDEPGSRTALGVQREFREKNEENGNVALSMTAKRADSLLADMD